MEIYPSDTTTNVPLKRCSFCGWWHRLDVVCLARVRFANSLYGLYGLLDKMTPDQVLEFLKMFIQLGNGSEAE